MSKKDKLITSINSNPDLKNNLKNAVFNLLHQVMWIESTSKEYKPIVADNFKISVDIDKFMFDFLGETNYSVRGIYNLGEHGLVKLLNEYAQSKKDLYDSITFVNKSNQDSFKWKGSPEQLNKLYEALKVDYIDSQTDIKNFRKVFSGEPIRSIKKVNWILVAPKNKQPDKKALITLFDLLQPVFIEKIDFKDLIKILPDLFKPIEGNFKPFTHSNRPNFKNGFGDHWIELKKIIDTL
jgi:hypothetical protein